MFRIIYKELLNCDVNIKSIKLAALLRKPFQTLCNQFYEPDIKNKIILEKSINY